MLTHRRNVLTHAMREGKGLAAYPWWQRAVASLLEEMVTRAVHNRLWRSVQARQLRSPAYCRRGS